MCPACNLFTHEMKIDNKGKRYIRSALTNNSSLKFFIINLFFKYPYGRLWMIVTCCIRKKKCEYSILNTELSWRKRNNFRDLHCVESLRIQNFCILILLHSDLILRSTSYFSVFSSNGGKYRPEKLQIWTMFTLC